jgi:type II secretory ATPase GspE/PulE/Tfp pilus assembly ATPase PilB-like protein
MGFRTDRNGLYVYPLHDDTRFFCVFVPNGAVKDYSIGPPIGEFLVKERLVTEKEIDSSLKIQAEKRQKPLGGYLRENAVVTALDLKQAIELQKTLPNMKIGEVLIKEGLITEEQLNEALEVQKQHRKQPLGEILVTQGLIGITDLQLALAKKLGFPYVDLKKFDIDHDAAKLIPESLARKYCAMPLCVVGDKLFIAMENPMAWEALEEVRFHTGKQVDAAIATREDIVRVIDIVFSSAAGMDDVSLAEFDAVQTGEEEADAEVAESDNVVVKLVNQIIAGAHGKGASDIHIEPDPSGAKTRVRIRKDGELLPFYEIPPKLRRAVPARIKVMAGLDISERRKPQDGKINFRRVGKQNIELRVATLPTVGGQEDVVMRILAGGKPLPLAELGLSQHNNRELLQLVEKPYGLIMVCGPTGSGKTTTLHSVLAHINTPNRKIWTVEDPVEIVQQGLRQVQVHAKIGLDFATVMRAFLRADPDVIMLGEMRDRETTHTGIEASLTGHLVFSTLHTNSAPESIVRLLDMGMDPFNFADALLGILAQRLTRRLCSHCKTAYRPAGDELHGLLTEYCRELDAAAGVREQANAVHEKIVQEWKRQFADPSGQFTLYRAVGCRECDNTGYKGRVGIHELLVASDTIKKQIVDAAPVAAVLNTAVNEGMRTLKQDGIEKVLQGITDMQQVRKVCVK